MTELEEIFAELGISQYLKAFIDQGFDSWDIILDITESDFDVLGVKLGHRRKLQRRIANSRGLSTDRALGSPRYDASDDKPSEEGKGGAAKADVKDGPTQGAKRKYRRHPKPDENAPERPPSAYVIFSNKMREDLKGRNLSFTEIAKLVGENWQNLAPTEKEPYEQQASAGKERYNGQLLEYKKTQSYRDYQRYLVEFKARQANQQRVSDLEVTKRPKLEPQFSTNSNGTNSSNGSQHEGDAPNGRPDVRSTASTPNQWHATNGHTSPSSFAQPKPYSNSTAVNRQPSPQGASPAVLPGYRDSIFPTAHQSPYWKDVRREDYRPLQQLPGISSIGERRSSTSWSASESLVSTGTFQHTRRTGTVYSPPLLTTESTNRSTESSNSTSSSAVYTPSTPVDQDRMLPPFTVAFPPEVHIDERQGTPLRTASLSSQTTVTGLQSPIGITAKLEFPPLQPNRAYPSTLAHAPLQTDPRLRDLISTTLDDDGTLDPVSALLKAGEIVNRSRTALPDT